MKGNYTQKYKLGKEIFSQFCVTHLDGKYMTNLQKWSEHWFPGNGTSEKVGVTN